MVFRPWRQGSRERADTVKTARSFRLQIQGSRSGYCKFLVTHGEDWQVLDGLEEGVTHLSKRSPGVDTSFVWNFPINVAYRSTNIFGWPQLVLSVYDVDNLGR